MNFDEFLQNTLSDAEKKVMELLHENFRQQSFFGKPWATSKNPAKGGKKILYQSGDLQDSFHSAVEGQEIHITSSVEYAGIHNEGGDITVTAKMKKYFWAMYYKAAGGVTKTAGGKVSSSQRNVALTGESLYWKNLALMKTGSKLHIPSRKFIGDDPALDAAIEKVIDRNMEELANELGEQFKNIQ